MFTVVVVMFGVLLVAGVVVLYVAYPHRGEDVPAAPWVGEALSRAAQAAPTIDGEEYAVRPSARRADRPAPRQRQTAD